MTPYYADSWLTVYQGDNREVLRTMEPESVHCVVTSPPYWGLRDYGDAGQLGLEPTPEEYVANMVAVFREVRRVLRADGTVFLNLGDSYMSSGERTTGRNDAVRQGKKTGGGFDAGPRTRVASSSGSDARPYGTSGTTPEGSTGRGSSSLDLCDGCRAASEIHIVRTDDPLSPTRGGGSRDPIQAHMGSGLDRPANAGSAHPTPTPRSAAAIQDQPQTLDPGDAPPLASLASTTPRSEPLPLDECSHCANCGACLSVLRSSDRDAQACARRSDRSLGSTPSHDPSSDRSDTEREAEAYPYSTSPYRLKAKDLVGIPWRVAFALQADGWYLRSDIIWSKPNPMPESVTDRPTKAHEYLFLLSKSPRYYYDADAVREDSVYPAGHVVTIPDDGKSQATVIEQGIRTRIIGERTMAGGRNLRSVWTIATQPYPGAHFATFPRKLVEPCIKAGTSEKGVCPECGAPWERMTVRSAEGPVRNAAEAHNAGTGLTPHSGYRGTPLVETTGWEPSCEHRLGDDDYNAASYPPLDPLAATVLDPFAGSGTTGMVAQALGRRAILIDLNADYLAQALTRNRDIPLGLSA